MSIQQTFVTDLESFKWSNWRALRIIKEKRVNGEYFFANIMRYYGERADSSDHDIGDTMGETAWLGRIEKFVGKRVRELDHDSPEFGKRISLPAITETIEDTDLSGKTIKREVLVEGKTIYEYTIPVTEANTKKMKSIAGAIGLNQETQFLFIYGASPPLVVDPETFFKTSVSDYLQNLKTQRENGPKK